MRDHDALLLAAGQAAHPLRGEPGGVDGRQHLVDSGRPAARWQRDAEPVAVEAEPDQVARPHRHVRVELDLLRNVADQLPALRRRQAADRDLAGRQRLQAEDDAQQRGLPGAVRADQPDELAGPETEPDVLQDVAPAEPDAGPVDGQDLSRGTGRRRWRGMTHRSQLLR